jgi:hypothetical protein
MRNRYNLIILAAAVIIILIGMVSCSNDKEDIAAPSINILQPIENDTVKLTNGFVQIHVVASDHVDIHDMEMNVKDETGKVVYEYDLDDLREHSYACDEKFYPGTISHVTLYRLTVTFENEYKNWETKGINFYVKP